jgi:hypothetical protein
MKTPTGFKPHEAVYVDEIPNCDLCSQGLLLEPATHDAKLPGLGGSWGYVCERHFKAFGPGKTGLGLAQRLILRPKVAT